MCERRAAAGALGGMSLVVTDTQGPTARHPNTCGSIPQHNTLQHLGSMEPVMHGKMGLPSESARAVIMFADGHTASNTPDLFRPPKLSGAGPG